MSNAFILDFLTKEICHLTEKTTTHKQTRFMLTVEYLE